MHTHSPNKPKKFKHTLSARKLMATVFWDRKGVLMVEFMQEGTTVMSEVYCETQKTT
jgi:acyl-CoA thioesterase